MTTIIKADGTKPSPMPLPSKIRIESAGPRKEMWSRLTDKQKQLAYHLSQAALSGRDLLFFQLHRHGITIKKLLIESLSAKNFSKTKKFFSTQGFESYLIYAAKFLDQAGPYASSNRKYHLGKVNKDTLEKLYAAFGPKTSKAIREEVISLMIDPDYEVQLYPENQNGDGLEKTGGNLYEKGITGAEVKAALDKTIKPNLNTRIIKQDGKLFTEIQTVRTSGLVGTKLKKVVAWLKKAIPFAETDYQKAEIQYMIKYFEKGVIEDFRQANIAWVKDRSNSTVDFMLGWVEIYEDWLGRTGSWESYVQIVDPEISKTAQKLASFAQYFEDAMPYGEFKKAFPANYSPPAMMVYYFQELSSYRSGGYNLPNFDDIRKNVGAKNVIRLPLPGETADPNFQSMWRENLTEFLPTSKVELALKEREKVWRVLVLLHEIIGHGSGTYDVTKYGKDEDPISALGPLGSALEEQRADLTALVFAGDSKLIETGLYQNKEEALSTLHLMYDFYLADFLRRTSGQRTFTEAHQRGHWLFIKYLLEKGAITWANKDGSTNYTPENGVLIVKDYEKFHTLSKELLGELQHIKAVRDEAGLKNIFEKYAPLDEIQAPWAQAVIKRGEKLLINAGYVEQPWKVDSKGNFEILGTPDLETIAKYWNEVY